MRAGGYFFFAVAALAIVAADWPGFLGPNQDLTSPERGIVWPPKKLWSLPAGEGYTGPAVVAGRLYLFDRVGATARLRCIRSDDATTVWTASYVTDYVDRLGFDGGPGHGFVAQVPVGAGSYSVCATAVNVGEGADVPLGACLPVTVP